MGTLHPLLLSALVASALCACSTPQMRSEARMDGAARMCANAGMGPGTDAYASCVQTVYANETQADAQRRAALLRAGLQMMQPPPAQPPPPRGGVCVPVMRNGSYYCQ